MESRSSESNYGWGSGYSSSSESSYSSESRNNYSSYSSSGESNYSSESRDDYSSYESGGESRESYHTQQSTTIKYNSLDDIDDLIQRLESSLPNEQINNEQVNKAIEARKQKIAQLKQLVKAAREEEKINKILQQLESGNQELDQAIESLNRGLHR